MSSHDTETIGHSVAGRPLTVRFAGRASTAGRVFILAAQHGDEPLARQAAERFLREAADPRGARCAVLACANPDGAASDTRRNAEGVDLNRDHQMLAASETRAIHQFVRRWQPHWIVDVHTYPPRRKHLLARGFEYCHDLFVDASNNISFPPEVRVVGRNQTDQLMEAADAWSVDGSHPPLCGRYTIVTTSGNVRHSTPDIVDARNGLALRCGAVGVLLEGRQPTRFDPPGAGKRTEGALTAALQWLATSPPSLHPAQGGPSVPVSSRYLVRDTPCDLPLRAEDSRQIQSVALDAPYFHDLEETTRVALPRGYAIPRDCTDLIELLRRHGWQDEPPTPGPTPVEVYQIDQVEPSTRPRRPPLQLKLRCHRRSRRLDEYVVFPVTTDGANALAVFLEPQSKYGLIRYPDLGLHLQAGREYPILRIAAS